MVRIGTRIESANEYALTRISHTPYLIRTDHTRGKLQEFPSVLLKALIAAEDGNFWDTTAAGFEFRSYVRAGVRSVLRSMLTLSLVHPRGSVSGWNSSGGSVSM